jgi:hypothetical protein
MPKIGAPMMYKMLFLIMIALSSQFSFAGKYEINYFESSNLNELPFDLPSIQAFQDGFLKIQMSFVNSDNKAIAEINQENAIRNRKELQDGFTKLALVTDEEGKLAAVTWIRTSQDDLSYTELSQTSVTAPDVYPFMIKSIFHDLNLEELQGAGPRDMPIIQKVLEANARIVNPRDERYNIPSFVSFIIDKELINRIFGSDL